MIATIVTMPDGQLRLPTSLTGPRKQHIKHCDCPYFRDAISLTSRFNHQSRHHI